MATTDETSTGTDYQALYTGLVLDYCAAREVGDTAGMDQAVEQILGAVKGLILRHMHYKLPTRLRDGSKVHEDLIQDVNAAVFEELTRMTPEDADTFHRRLRGKTGIVTTTMLTSQQQWVLPNVCTSKERQLLRVAYKQDEKLREEGVREPTIEEIVARTTLAAHRHAEKNLMAQGKTPTAAAVESYLTKNGEKAALRNLGELYQLEKTVRSSLRAGFDDHFHTDGSSPTFGDELTAAVRVDGPGDDVLGNDTLMDLAAATLTPQERTFLETWPDAGVGITEAASAASLTVPAAKQAIARSAATLASPVAAFVTAGDAGMLFEEPEEDGGLGAALALATASLQF